MPIYTANETHEKARELAYSFIDTSALAGNFSAGDRLTEIITLALLSSLEPAEGEIGRFLSRQVEWSKRTFGAARRTLGITRQIEKEIAEVRAKPDDLSEWIDIIILAIDGYWRHGGTPETIMPDLTGKAEINYKRVYPMPTSEDEPSEHVRELLPAPADEGWTGKPCPKCNGTGEEDDEHSSHSCPSCGGTGEEYRSVPAPAEPSRDPLMMCVGGHMVPIPAPAPAQAGMGACNGCAWNHSDNRPCADCKRAAPVKSACVDYYLPITSPAPIAQDAREAVVSVAHVFGIYVSERWDEAIAIIERVAQEREAARDAQWKAWITAKGFDLEPLAGTR